MAGRAGLRDADPWRTAHEWFHDVYVPAEYDHPRPSARCPRLAIIDSTVPFWEPVTAGPYVWHCHIVDHEDNEMMRPLLVIP